MKQREKVIPLASGNILEIGIGSGLNLAFYDQAKVNHITGIDPFLEIWEKKNLDPDELPFRFEFVQASAEEIPLDNNSIDTIVITYTMCSLPNTDLAFDEIRRVLKYNGKLIFCEHGKAPDKVVRRIQNTINPLWKRLGGGCNLNRNIPLLIEEGGLKIDQMETMYIPGWKPLSFNYWGTASIK